jgi:NTE family protein
MLHSERDINMGKNEIKYALALGGGGARGAFEAGVWRALCRLGIKISAVAGTSVGAVNGAAFAAGADAEELWKSIEIKDIVKLPHETDNLLSINGILSLLQSSFSGGLDTEPFRQLINHIIPEDRVRNSEIDFGLCTYSAQAKKPIELFIEDIPRGQLTDYILASACFPMFKPKIIDGEEFSDGGIRNNLPVNMLISRGYNTIISVSVRGIGMLCDFDECGANIIEIKSPHGGAGLMDFNKASIRNSIESGYIECMKTFGALGGDTYAFEKSSYDAAVMKYGKSLMENLESAAKLLDISPFKVYTFESLAESVLDLYTSNSKIKHMIDFIENNPDNPLREKLDLLGESFKIASTIAYLKKCGKFTK